MLVVVFRHQLWQLCMTSAVLGAILGDTEAAANPASRRAASRPDYLVDPVETAAGSGRTNDDDVNCDGAKARGVQSPVAVWSARSQRDDKFCVHQPQFANFDNVSTLAPNAYLLNVTERGVRLKVIASVPRTMTVTIDGEFLYVLKYVDLRWGSADNDGSEHSIDGKRFAIEVQFVLHKIGVLVKPTGQTNAGIDTDSESSWTAVVATFGDISVNDSLPHFEPIVDVLDKILDAPDSSVTAIVQPFPLLQLLPANRDRYFRYIGSLTDEPCSANVLWILYDTPIGVTTEQMEKFRALDEMWANRTMTSSEKNSASTNKQQQQPHHRLGSVQPQVMNCGIPDFMPDAERRQQPLGRHGSSHSGSSTLGDRDGFDVGRRVLGLAVAAVAAALLELG